MADPESTTSIPIESAAVAPGTDTAAPEPPAAQAPAVDSMEGVEVSVANDGETVDPLANDGEDNGENGLDENGENAAEYSLEVITKSTYIDYLKSPMVTITVGTGTTETKLSAHLALLIHSPYFADLCGSFTHSTPLEDRAVFLPNESLDAVGCFLQFLYIREYTPRLIPSAINPTELILESDEPNIDAVDEEGEALLKHARVYTLAEKLQLPELKTLAHSKIHRINSTARGELQYARFVYAHTPREDKTIRTPIASFWAHRSHVLRHEAEDEFRRMVLEFPQFAYDILSMVLDQKERGKEKPYREDRGDGMTDQAIEKIGKPSRKRPRTSTVA